jgi:hypothetical protein
MKKALPKDADLRGATKALQRAATNALKTARQTHTPCYVVKDGRIVDATKGPDESTPKSRRASG